MSEHAFTPEHRSGDQAQEKKYTIESLRRAAEHVADQFYPNLKTSMTREEFIDRVVTTMLDKLATKDGTTHQQ